jgi:hypothetical protein
MTPLTKPLRGSTLFRRAEFDAGLDRLLALRQPGQHFTQAQVARACGVSYQAMQQREAKIFAKIRQRFGIELKEYL